MPDLIYVFHKRIPALQASRLIIPEELPVWIPDPHRLGKLTIHIWLAVDSSIPIMDNNGQRHNRPRVPNLPNPVRICLSDLWLFQDSRYSTEGRGSYPFFKTAISAQDFFFWQSGCEIVPYMVKSGEFPCSDSHAWWTSLRLVDVGPV
jgi:hypothetical protein